MNNMNEIFENYMKKLLPKIDSEIKGKLLYSTPRTEEICEVVNDNLNKKNSFYDKDTEDSFYNNIKTIKQEYNTTKNTDDINIKKIKIKKSSNSFKPRKINEKEKGNKIICLNKVNNIKLIKEEKKSIENLPNIFKTNVPTFHKIRKLRPLNRSNRMLFDLYHNRYLSKNFSSYFNKTKISKEKEKNSIQYLNKLESNQALISPIKKLKGLKLMRQIKNNNALMNETQSENSSFGQYINQKEINKTNSTINFHENINRMNSLKSLPGNKINFWMLDYNKIAKFNTITNQNNYFCNYNIDTFNSFRISKFYQG